MNKNKRLLWQIFPSYLILILVSLFAVTWYASTAMRVFFIARIADDLEARARLFEKQVLDLLDRPDPGAIDALCKNTGKAASTRITVILPSGKVAADSDEDPAVMDNHADRPEVIAALRGPRGVSSRYSRTVERALMYVGVPVYKDTKLAAIVRVSVPIDAVDKAVRDTRIRIILGGLIITAFAAFLSFLISRRISRPLEELKACAQAFSRGDFRCDAPASGSAEIVALGDAMKDMARQLDQRFNTIMQQRNELTAVLSSMVEGVIAVDTDEHLVSANEAASGMLQIESSDMKGRSIQEVVRNTVLQGFVKNALSSETPVEKEIQLYSGAERTVQATGSPLYDPGGTRLGALIVLNDITRLRKLENIRREFVANVSHELKTPITAIRGFVETLQDGALQSRPDAERFLGIIERHARRLEAIIDDLLSLSRIEQDAEKESIPLKKAGILNPLKTAVQLCENSAASRGVQIQLICSEAITARINSALLEQAVVNLLDNAIKYSDSGTGIRVEADAGGEEVRIHVRDQGRGIEKEHLPRLFERFYRVDRGRSRQSGGTGLGLAIVKHIAQAHGGSVSVESTPGKGSTFTLHLPKSQDLKRPGP